MAVFLGVLTGAVAWSIGSATVTCGCNMGFAASSDLQTALTAARTYYDDDRSTFAGMTTESGATSAIQEMDTGLSFVSGRSSTGPRVVSTHVGDDGSYVVLSAFQTGTNDCMGILDVTKPQHRSLLRVDGRAARATAVGTYFFVIRKTSPSACNAAAIKSPSALSTTGFPGGH